LGGDDNTCLNEKLLDEQKMEDHRCALEVEKDLFNKDKDGAWEFRATYVCIELRSRAYFHLQQLCNCKGVCKKVRKNGKIKYEPCVIQET